MKNIVVVGGGIAGIYSAILAKKNGHNVVLVDQAESLGGLLRSKKYENGDSFDFGTHFIAGTNNPEIDDVILNNEFQKTWNAFPNENAGNYFSGKLTEDCIFVHTQNLPKEEYNQGLSDLIEALPSDKNFKSSKDQLEHDFGAGFTHSVFEPAMTKLFGTKSLSELAVGANLRFGMKRIVVGTPEVTRELKKVKYIDDKIAFHQFSEGAASKPQYYPKMNGAGEWIDYLEKELDELGVEVCCSTAITKIHHNDKIIKSIEFENRETIEVDELIWTVPAAFLLRSAKVDFQGVRPDLRKTVILNYTFDQKPLTGCHFFFCYDPNYLPFRVTLYSNLQEDLTEKTQRHRVTVEVLTDPASDTSDYSLTVYKQLIEMGILKENTKILFQDNFNVPSGFPVLSHEFQKNVEMVEGVARDSFSNITLVGRASSKTWFMVDVFNDVYKKVKDI